MTKLFSPVLCYLRSHHTDDGPHFDLLRLFSPVLCYWHWHHIDDGPHFYLLRLFSPVLSYWRWHHIDDGPHFDLLQQHHRPCVLHSSWAESNSFPYYPRFYSNPSIPYPFISFYGSRSLALKRKSNLYGILLYIKKISFLLRRGY